LGVFSDCVILKESLSFVDTLYQDIEVPHVGVNLKDWQVNKHTGDLGS